MPGWSFTCQYSTCSAKPATSGPTRAPTMVPTQPTMVRERREGRRRGRGLIGSFSSTGAHGQTYHSPHCHPLDESDHSTDADPYGDPNDGRLPS
jgi:hypothetical protein